MSENKLTFLKDIGNKGNTLEHIMLREICKFNIPTKNTTFGDLSVVTFTKDTESLSKPPIIYDFKMPEDSKFTLKGWQSELDSAAKKVAQYLVLSIKTFGDDIPRISYPRNTIGGLKLKVLNSKKGWYRLVWRAYLVREEL